MLSTTPIYIIWCGAWATTQQVIVEDLFFFNNVTDSNWLMIQSTYYQETETETALTTEYSR
jgi:hypothetical protein